MYMHGQYTDQVLPELGITICSDGVNKESNGLSLVKENYFHFPINVIPDHEHLIHAERTPEWIADWQKRYNWSDDFGPDSYPIDQWREIFLKQIHDNEKNGIVSNVILHPITMYLCDQFKSVEIILNELKKYKIVNFSDLISEAYKQKSA